MKTYILTEKEIREIVSESYVCGIHKEHYRIDFSKLKESQPSISAEEFLKEKGVIESALSKPMEEKIRFPEIDSYFLNNWQKTYGREAADGFMTGWDEFKRKIKELNNPPL
jgi:hypothetical protein